MTCLFSLKDRICLALPVASQEKPYDVVFFESNHQCLVQGENKTSTSARISFELHKNSFRVLVVGHALPIFTTSTTSTGLTQLVSFEATTSPGGCWGPSCWCLRHPSSISESKKQKMKEVVFPWEQNELYLKTSLWPNLWVVILVPVKQWKRRFKWHQDSCANGKHNLVWGLSSVLKMCIWCCCISCRQEAQRQLLP